MSHSRTDDDVIVGSICDDVIARIVDQMNGIDSDRMNPTDHLLDSIQNFDQS